jgi:hypothetical protein
MIRFIRRWKVLLKLFIEVGQERRERKRKSEDGISSVERGMGSVKRLEFDALPREGG